LIPLSLYLKDGKVKVNLGVCRGKKDYDKRDVMLEKAAKRDIDRQMKERYR
ncbi:MAG TPA: SsrA-binding protein, partial [Clostridium sp.]|nr:SsrA-binding protein [Clostridium sp.]